MTPAPTYLFVTMTARARFCIEASNLGIGWWLRDQTGRITLYFMLVKFVRTRSPISWSLHIRDETSACLSEARSFFLILLCQNSENLATWKGWQETRSVSKARFTRSLQDLTQCLSSFPMIHCLCVVSNHLMIITSTKITFNLAVFFLNNEDFIQAGFAFLSPPYRSLFVFGADSVRFLHEILFLGIRCNAAAATRGQTAAALFPSSSVPKPRRLHHYFGCSNREFLYDTLVNISITRFGPNRPAADMEGNGEFNFCLIYEDFWRIFWEFLEN